MKVLVLIVYGLVLLLARPVEAADVSFDLHAVKFGDLARVVLDDVGGGSVILSPEVVKDQRELTFTVKKTTGPQAVELLQKVAAGLGYSVASVGGVWYVGQAEEDSEIVVYLPKAKSASYLVEIVNGVVPGAKSATSRVIEQPNAPPNPSTDEQPGTVSALVGKSAKELLVLSVPRQRVALVKSLLEQVDIPSPEIAIKALLVEVQTGRSDGSAINFLLSVLGGKFGIQWSGGADEKRGVSVSIGAVEALWSAIETDRRFRVLSSPRLRVKSGASARFSVGSEVPVLGAVTYPQGGGQPVQSINYKPAGVILDLSPEIRGSMAEIKIRQQLSDFVKTENGVNNSPTLLKRELSTTVAASAGDLVILGGLNESKDTFSRSGFFFLPDSLHSTNEENSSTEILMLMHVEKLGVGI